MGRGPSAGADHGAAVAHRGGGPGRSPAAPRKRDAASDVSRRLPGRSSDYPLRVPSSSAPFWRAAPGRWSAIARPQDSGGSSSRRRTRSTSRWWRGVADRATACGSTRWTLSMSAIGAPARHPDRRAGAHPHRLRLDGRRRGGRTRNRRGLCARSCLASRGLIAAIERAPQRAGVARVRAILGQDGGPAAPAPAGASDAQADSGRQTAGPAHQPPVAFRRTSVARER